MAVADKKTEPKILKPSKPPKECTPHTPQKNLISSVSSQEYENTLYRDNHEIEKDVIVYDQTNDKWIIVKESKSYLF